MNFFEHQDEARRSTRRLVILFCLAVFILLVLTNTVIIFGLWFLDTNSFQKEDVNFENLSNLKSLSDYINLKHIALISFINIAIIGLEIAMKRSQLSGGGKVVAEYLSGRRIDHSSKNNDEKIILNVVEEMAIASGSLVPPIYILPEPGINAFAAGFSPGDAVIGISRGAIEQLDRDQLQGVVAHEFSHIYNGDMRLNINLIAVLSGIEFIGNTGWFLIRVFGLSGGMRRERRSTNPLPAIAGFVLVLIGFLGKFFGSLIKAAVSRQREFLADASAVQFTRNPEGIAGALKMIGGSAHGSIISANKVSEVSHLFFSNALPEKFSLSFSSLLSTHPPLKQRIKRIEPRWDGLFLSKIAVEKTRTRKNVDRADKNQNREKQILGALGTVIGGAAAVGTIAVGTQSSMGLQLVAKETLSQLDEAVDHIGNTGEASVDEAKDTLATLQVSIKQAAYNTDSAKALIYLMLLDKQEGIRAEQEKYLRAKESEKVIEHMDFIAKGFLSDPNIQRLSILELAVPALKNMNHLEYKNFKLTLVFLIKADKNIDLFEWLLHRLAIHYLKSNFEKISPPKPIYKDLSKLRNECKFLLSHLSYIGEENSPNGYQKVFSKGFESLDLGKTNIVPSSQLSIKDLNDAIYHFSYLYPLAKPRLLKACAKCIQADNVIGTDQLELFRAISSLLDCPMPLLSINDLTTKN